MNTPQRPFQVWLTVVRREYVTRVRRRAFLVATLLGPVLWVGLVAGLVLLTQSTESPAKVWVVDHDGLLTAPAEGGQFVPTCPSCYPERTLLTYRFGREPKDAATLEAEGFTCMVELDEGIVQSEKAQLLHLEPPTGRAKRWMQRDLSQALERLKVREQSNLNYDDYLALKTDVVLVGLDMATGEQKGAGQGGLGFVFSIFMLTFVLVYGMHVMRGVIEEKSNRIVEVVLSTVRPGQLLAGKIAGIGLVGLTQIAAWAVLSWGLMAVLGMALEQSAWMESWAATQGLTAGTADFLKRPRGRGGTRVFAGHQLGRHARLRGGVLRAGLRLVRGVLRDDWGHGGAGIGCPVLDAAGHDALALQLRVGLHDNRRSREHLGHCQFVCAIFVAGVHDGSVAHGRAVVARGAEHGPFGRHSGIARGFGRAGLPRRHFDVRQTPQFQRNRALDGASRLRRPLMPLNLQSLIP